MEIVSQEYFITHMSACRLSSCTGCRSLWQNAPLSIPSPPKSLAPAASGSLPVAHRPQIGPAAAPAAPAHSAGLSQMRARPAAPGLGVATQMQPPSAQPAEGSVSLERQASAAPAPGAAARRGQEGIQQDHVIQRVIY